MTKEQKLSPQAKEKEAQKEERLAPGYRTISATVNNTEGKPIFTVSIDIEPEPDDCTCYKDGLHSLGSVASIRAGDTDPDCPHHGVN